MISIICPTYNEEKYISKCIESMLSQDFPLDEIELLFIDGGSADNTRKIIEQYAQQYLQIQLLDNPHKFVPYAMNIGIKNAKGDIIIRIDAHASFPPDYVRVLSENLIKTGADNVGVFGETDVSQKTDKTLAIREVLSHPLGVGNSIFRVGDAELKQPLEVDTVPFGCYKKEVFEKYGLYNEKLVRNQDIELNKRIKHGGGKILLIPDTHCTYYARETFKAVMKNNYQNGKWNILTVYYTNDFKSLSVRHFVPMLFVFSLVLPIIASAFYLPLIFISLFSLLLYLSAIIAVSSKLAISQKLKFRYLFFSFLSLHFSYGIGSLAGICQIFLGKK